MIFEIGLVVLLLLLGYVFGQLAESRHLKSLVRRELAANSLPAIASRFPPEDDNYSQHLVTGSVVVASDYFKTFTAGLINIFGGRVTPFEGLLDRARREALLRMKDEAARLHARYVFNLKYETTRIAQSGAGAVEVLVYGTALIPADHPGELAEAVSKANR
jgi:uncharacterized protein YbjQ (UPF0145 family)